MFFAAAEAQTYRRRVVKLRFFSPCFEYQDLFVGNRIVYPSESYFSRKVMSEVSVSRRRRSPSARSALPLTCTLTRPLYSVIDIVEKARKIVSTEKFSCSLGRPCRLRAMVLLHHLYLVSRNLHKLESLVALQKIRELQLRVR
jgi:hypothetical protein